MKPIYRSISEGATIGFVLIASSLTIAPLWLKSRITMREIIQPDKPWFKLEISTLGRLE